jgi:hypothetical protein
VRAFGRCWFLIKGSWSDIGKSPRLEPVINGPATTRGERSALYGCGGRAVGGWKVLDFTLELAGPPEAPYCPNSLLAEQIRAAHDDLRALTASSRELWPEFAVQKDSSDADFPSQEPYDTPHPCLMMYH